LNPHPIGAAEKAVRRNFTVTVQTPLPKSKRADCFH